MKGKAEGQTFDIAIITMASATTTTSFNLNPVGEGYKKTTTGDERQLLSEGEFFDLQEINVHCLYVQIIEIFLWNCAHSLEGGLSSIAFFRYFKGDMDK